MKKKNNLEFTFYRNFICLIAAPILVLILVAFGLIRNMVLGTNVDNIRLAHNHINSELASEMADASLTLSHFLLVNDHYALELAAQYSAAESTTEKYRYANELTQYYNILVQPRSNVIAVHFIMKNGEQYCLKDESIMDTETLRQAAWYQNALQNPGHIFSDLAAEPVTYSLRNERNKTSLVVALSPTEFDRYGQIEMVCLYLKSSVSNWMESYTNELDLLNIALLGPENDVYFQGTAYPYENVTDTPVLQGTLEYTVREGYKDVLYMITPVFEGGYRLVSVTDTGAMLKDFSWISALIVTVSCLIFALFFLFSRMFMQQIIQPVNNLGLAMQNVREGNTFIQVEEGGHWEIRQLGVDFNSMIQRINYLMDRVKEHESEKHRAEMKVLRSQINPHFLVNTLNTMRFMSIATKFDGMKNMTDSLIRILSCLFRSQSDFYLMREEVEVLESYIYLMKIRYSNNFEVEIRIPESLHGYQVPRLMLQPIVENSIVHGFEEMIDIGHILIQGELEGDKLRLLVRDDGKGMSQERVSEIMGRSPDDIQVGIGIGVPNVKRRIQLHFGEEYGLTMESVEGEYTQTVLTLPAILPKTGGEYDTDTDRG